MLSALETRLATVLGSDLPAPLTGRVGVRPSSASGSGPRVEIAIRTVKPVTPDFGAVRPEIAPGAASPRRIVRLQAQIDLRVEAGPGGDRSDTTAAVDQLIYFLDAPAMRSGAALRDVGDPGFLLETLLLDTSDLAPDLSSEPPADVTLSAIGWFWPIGEVGQDGPAIAEARISQLVFPATQSPDPARFITGAGETEIAIGFTSQQMMVLQEGGLGAMAPIEVVFQLRASDGSAGAGQLTNGRALPDGDRARPLADGAADIRYQPPAQAGTDQLILRRITPDPDGDHLGPELMRIDLITQAAS